MDSTQLPDTTNLALRLASLAEGNDDYWSFVDHDEREHVHMLFQYPAMMVPQMQRKLLELFIEWDPTIRTVYDPFMGSGTVMTESMLQGRDFIGTDINPLAILIARAKSGTFDSNMLQADLSNILDECNRSQPDLDVPEFPNIDKWFAPEVKDQLSQLRHAIVKCPHVRSRRFWWITLAETVRLSCNSRTSTVKLHIRPENELRSRPSALGLFRNIARRNLQVLKEQRQLLHDRQCLLNNTYTGQIRLQSADVRKSVWPLSADLMITSPPYGDNHTTVTYGQASYLPLRWIDRRDIGGISDRSIAECVENTHRIDTLSLGGSRRKYGQRTQHVLAMLERSPTLREIEVQLRSTLPERWRRVSTFYADLDESIDTILQNVRPLGLLAWIVGDRTVGGKSIPMGRILNDLVGDRVDLVAALPRRIPPTRKRMAPNNGTGPTVRMETVVVMRKTAET